MTFFTYANAPDPNFYIYMFYLIFDWPFVVVILLMFDVSFAMAGNGIYSVFFKDDL